MNLSGWLAGIICILLVLLTARPFGQVSFQIAKAQIPAHGSPRQTLLAEAEPNAWIVLLEGRPLAAFRLQFGGKAELNEGEKNQVRAYWRYLEAAQSSFVTAARREGVNLIVHRRFSYLLNGLAVSVPAGEIELLTALQGVRAIYPDRQVHLELADSVPMIGADEVWQMRDSNQVPVTGQGVRVAVVDTGIDYTHPDLGGCFGPGCKVVGGYDLYNNDFDPRDDNGHGTHCAGIVAADGSLKGVAPGASLYAYKVLSAYGTGTVSVIIAGIERAADPDQDPTTTDMVDIISMSLGAPGTPDDPWSLAVDAAAQQGIVVAVSAGNSGPDYASMESPGMARGSIAVGAVDKSDLIAIFSSRGPLPGFEDWLKPDILAPGVDIVSTYLDGTYASSSGTSMSAPHVAGAAALVKQIHPTWSPDQIKASLMNTAQDLGVNLHIQGAGRLQVDQAALTPGLVTPANANFGTVDFSQPLWSDTRLFWVENVSESVRSYSLIADTLLPGSVSASVEPNSMDLMPGEKRSFLVTLAVNPLQTPPDLERNEGLIRVQQGGVVLRVPFAFRVPPIFSDSRILPFGLQTSYAVALHDLDGDGDMDAFIGNTSYYDNPANTVWFNDGEGNFADSGQRLGDEFTWDIAIGDLDGDGDFDVFAANSEVDHAQPDKVWLNNGQGIFIDSGQDLGDTLSRSVALGDLDGDGDLDAYIANGISARGQAEADQVWLNDGHGVFHNNGQSLGDEPGLDVELGDLDGDGDLDAFVANGDPLRVRDAPNEIWLNDGHGFFSKSGQNLGDALSQAVALGDLDMDGDIDAFVANGGPGVLEGQPDEVWLNNSFGLFSNTGQNLGSESSYGAVLGDLFQDGIIDVFVAGYHGGNRVWLNDGRGNFTLSSPGFGTENTTDAALGDVDGDGDLDALVANALSMPNRLWLNRGSDFDEQAVLAAPSGLDAAVSSSQIDLTWIDNAIDETGYQVLRSLDGMSDWIQIVELPANSTHYSDAAISCDQQYYYRVRAFRAVDQTSSLYSNIAIAETEECTLSAPTDLLVSNISCSQIRLTWMDNAADESSYRVERSFESLVGWMEIAVLPENTTAYIQNGLTLNTDYYFRVRAYRENDERYSLYSNTAETKMDLCQYRLYFPVLSSVPPLP